MSTTPATPALRFDGRPIGSRLSHSAISLQAVGDADQGLGLLEPSENRAGEPRRRRVELRVEERELIERELPRLTPRELDVLTALIEGGSNEQIALELGIALPTLRTHLARISQKVGATGRADLLRLGVALVLEAYRDERLLRRTR